MSARRAFHRLVWPLVAVALLAPAGEAAGRPSPPIWPVDVHGAPLIRGGFGDMRGVGYHFGVDIAVNDHEPAPDAPSGLSHPVSAIRAGYVFYSAVPEACIARRVMVDGILYDHVSPTLPVGSRVGVGRQIGWTCRGNWHVHISQLAHPHRHDGVWLNPLGPGGVFAGYQDTRPPRVGPISLTTPGLSRVLGPPAWPLAATARYADSGAPISDGMVAGVVDIRARMADPRPPGALGLRYPWLQTRGLPYRAEITIRNRTGRVVYRNVPFIADLLGAQHGTHLPTNASALFAAGTEQPTAAPDCMLAHSAGRACVPGVYWIHMTSHVGRVGLDTALLPNGRYTISVEAWDASGNSATAERTMIIQNRLVGGAVAPSLSRLVTAIGPRLRADARVLREAVGLAGPALDALAAGLSEAPRWLLERAS